MKRPNGNSPLNWATVAALAMVPQAVLANLPASDSVGVVAERVGDQVVICMARVHEGVWYSIGCQDHAGIVRLDQETGVALKLGANCSGVLTQGTIGLSGCVVDACVPQGSYRYGVARLPACESGELVGLLTEVKIPESPLECSEDPGWLPAVPFVGELPFGEDQVLPCPDPTSDDGDPSQKDPLAPETGGCQTAQPAATALGLQLLALFTGLFWLRRRTR